ncbi:MAG: hypothetical protein NW703_18500, partial [Nitrospiraceae bacterium]
MSQSEPERLVLKEQPRPCTADRVYHHGSADSRNSRPGRGGGVGQTESPAAQKTGAHGCYRRVDRPGRPTAPRRLALMVSVNVNRLPNEQWVPPRGAWGLT